MPLPLPSSAGDIAALQTERKRVAIERARAAPFHKTRLANIDAEKAAVDPAAWSDIPVLDKEELRGLPPKKFQSDFFVGDPADVAEFWRSGGATGVPLFYPRSHEDLKYAMLSFSRVFDCAGVGKPGDRTHVSYPLGIHPVGHMFCRAAQSRGMGVNWAGSGASTPSPAQVQLIQTLDPTIWLGMGTYAIHLANLAEAQDIDLASASVGTILTSAEPLSIAKREKIERMWGATVFDTFGMTECGMMGCEDAGHDGFRVWSDMFFIEVLDPETFAPVAEGEVGTLVVTPLWTNNATPFIRWSSGDLVTLLPAGGDGPFSVFPRVRHAHRTTGFFKVRGVNINHSEFEDMMFANPDINDFKAEALSTESTDILRVSIEVRRAADPDAVSATIGGQIKTTFEVTPEIVVLETGSLAREFEGAIKAQRFQDNRG